MTTIATRAAAVALALSAAMASAAPIGAEASKASNQRVPDDVWAADTGREFNMAWRLLNLNLQYEKFMDVWIANDKSINDIQRAFDDNRKAHEKFFTDLKAFAQKYEVNPKVPDELNALEEQLKGLLKDFELFEAKYSYLNEYDYDLDLSLFAIKKGLNVLNVRFGIVRDFYASEKKQETETVTRIDTAMKNVSEAMTGVFKMRNQNREMTIKRQSAYHRAYLVVKSNLKVRFANKAKIELSELEKQINEVFKADKVSDRLWSWSGRHSINGIGGHAYWTYYQWQQTFRNIQTAIQEGYPIGAEIDALKLPESAKRPMVRKYRSEMKYLKEGIAELKEAGWQSFSATHRRRADRWLGRPDDFSKECVADAKTFLDKYPEDATFERYLVQEQDFKRLTLTCMRKDR